ncbi:LacI family DNA-binding transcriptional regulator [Paenibacillus nasutitermitis]|uniref:LacI family transcriptional regulator n=1 Tax=Paenibacillus nasutitermitis TaxID=1652958 RepID=A0A917E1P0_9BACL|nr:LacI family DNA-binding transcriptional regulator [Paenibacillus nasutitermitis]GGD90238.1 LacI family transcriptional regulator [Paenibacillus nasutitermitis]
MNIYDIAEKAGVSIATVSRVMNNPAAVSAKTRDKVLEIIQSANFMPKLGANLNKSRDLAFFTTAQALQLENSIMAGIGEVAFAEKLNIKLCPLDELPKKRNELAGFFAEKGIGGAIFTSVPYNEEHYNDVARAVPSILLFNQLDAYKVNYIRADHHKSGFIAIQHLAHMNHKHIAIVDEFKSADHHDRLAGTREAGVTFGLGDFTEDHLINVSNLDEMDMCAQIDHYLLRYPQTTALFVANDHFVPTLYRHFRSRGIRIPEDISVVGADDVPGSADLYPPLTTVRQPVKQMSMKAAQALIDIMHGLNPPEQAVEEVYDVQLVVRASTRRVPE